jgi:hypothetical protein
VAGKHVTDLLLVGMGHLSQEMGHGTKYPGSAEPALQGVMFGECALQLVERAGLGKAFHGHDVRTVCLRRVLSAAAHCASIDQDRTGSADAMLAADMNPESLELMTQEIAEQHARLGLARSALPIQRQLDRKSFTGGTMQRRHCR